MLSGSDVVWLSYELRGLPAVLDFVMLSFFWGVSMQFIEILLIFYAHWNAHLIPAYLRKISTFSEF